MLHRSQVGSTLSLGWPRRLAPTRTHGEPDQPLRSQQLQPSSPKEATQVWGGLLTSTRYLSAGASLVQKPWHPREGIRGSESELVGHPTFSPHLCLHPPTPRLLARGCSSCLGTMGGWPLPPTSSSPSQPGRSGYQGLSVAGLHLWGDWQSDQILLTPALAWCWPLTCSTSHGLDMVLLSSRAHWGQQHFHCHPLPAVLLMPTMFCAAP